MDRLEQRLKDYYKYHEEYQPEAISGEFLERLKALESSPEAARRPRRRYVLPVAAAAALVLAIGGWFAWQRTVTPEPAQMPVAIQSGRANDAVETPSEPSKPAAKPQAGTKEPKPREEQISEGSVTMTKPAQSPMSGCDTPTGSNGGAASTPNYRPHVLPGGNVTAKPGDTLPILPTDEIPGNPNDETAVNPDEESSAGPSGETPAKPKDETPSEPAIEPSKEPDDEKPDDPKPAEPDDPSPDDTKPANDAPQIPPYVSPYGAVYQMRDGSETLTVTRLATGESVEIDVTGWMEQAIANAISAGEHAQQPENPPENDGIGSGACIAFGTLIMYNLKLEADRTVSAEAFDPKEYAQYYAQYHQERENTDET